jgi:DNA topoisomerase I
MLGVDVATAERLAKGAGVVRLPPDAPGIERRRRGRGFSYLDPAGQRVVGEERARLEALAVPPAWSDVWIAPIPDSHILATGIDDAGRKQYVYHPRWRDAADTAKFERLADFGAALPRVRRQVVADLRSHEPSVSHCAALLRLVDRSLIRPGSRCYADENGTFGATTLLTSHVDVRGSTVHLVFPGKGGTEHELSVRDRVLAGHLRRLVATLDDDSHLFVDDQGRAVERDEVNAYLGRVAGDFTVKDFRTWGATCSVAAHLATSPVTDDQGSAVRDAIAETATALGNTPAVCRTAYVAPAVIEAHHAGNLRDAWKASRRSKWMTRAEWTTRRVLDGVTT